MLTILFTRYASLSLLHALLPLYFPDLISAVNGDFCKALPNSSSWPSIAEWNALTLSISGQVLRPLPPAAVCDESLLVFNNESCSFVASQYTVLDFHAKDPVYVDQSNWENATCLPGSEYHCYLPQFPPYVVNAIKATHVKAAVDFARLRNVRLIVKGTGHDYLGM